MNTRTITRKTFEIRMAWYLILICFIFPAVSGDIFDSPVKEQITLPGVIPPAQSVDQQIIITQPVEISASSGIEWQLSLGGTDKDESFEARQTSDGGYIIAGYSNSNDGEVSGNHGNYDFWIVRLSATRSVLWKYCFGGSAYDVARTIKQTRDGGFIVSGYTGSVNGDVKNTTHGGTDLWVVKLSSSGTIEWEKCFGGSENEIAYDIQQTTDGGFIIAGDTASDDGDVKEHHGEKGQHDYWVLKLTSDGVLEWKKCLGGSDDDRAYGVYQTKDGGYVVAGETSSYDGDVTRTHGKSDSWIVRLNAAGGMEWELALGGTLYDKAYNIIQNEDGEYIAVGTSQSTDQDVKGNHGFYDLWVMKISEAGDAQWTKCYGGSGSEDGRGIEQTTDGGYIIAGFTTSNDGDVSGKHENSDFWVLRINSSGLIEWQKCLGGSGYEGAENVQQTPEGMYLISGHSTSNNGDVNGNHGRDDFWLVKITNPAPAITSITPSYGQQGGTLQLKIVGTGFETKKSIVSFSGSGVKVAKYMIQTDKTIAASVTIAKTAKTGVRTLKVTNPTSGKTYTGTFTIKTAPKISKISPPNGPQGWKHTITITGTGFEAKKSTVSFSGSGLKVGKYTIPNDKKIVIPFTISKTAKIGPRVVTVKNPTYGGVATGTFTVGTPPTIKSFSPKSAFRGTKFPMTITGTGFEAKKSIVSFSGSGIKVIKYTKQTDKTIVVQLNVLKTASTGTHTVTVKNPSSGLSATKTFTVKAKGTSTNQVEPVTSISNGALSSPVLSSSSTSSSKSNSPNGRGLVPIIIPDVT